MNGRPGVHLDYHQTAITGINAELDVGTAGINTDLTDDLKRSIPQDLVFLISQGLSRSHGNGIAGMNPIGSKFSMEQIITTLSAVSRMTSKLPADYRLLHQDLVGW